MSKSGSVRDYYQVPVAEVIRETDEASSLVLDVPSALAGTFAYRPGQFVTVRVPSDRTGSVARCYSLCTSALAGDLPAITVKRTAGGYASNWLLDNVTAGTVLDLLPRPAPSARARLRAISCCSRRAAAAPRSCPSSSQCSPPAAVESRSCTPTGTTSR